MTGRSEFVSGPAHERRPHSNKAVHAKGGLIGGKAGRRLEGETLKCDHCDFPFECESAKWCNRMMHRGTAAAFSADGWAVACRRKRYAERLAAAGQTMCECA
jgi:hypothetical protein